MAIVTTDEGGAHDEPPGHADDTHYESEHESAEQRDHKERMAIWLFIAGDGIFFLLEVFTWFYLRALNTGGLWRGDDCSNANPCTDGLGNPIIRQVPKADPWYTVGVAALIVVAAILIWATERAARNNENRGVLSGLSGLGLVVLLAAIGLSIYQFQTLPFTTIDGAYASTFEFFVGSTLVHIILLAFIALGLWNRARKGRYNDGRWYRVRIIRYFAVWIAVSACILAIVMSLFA
jgi:heme/copper-type cytochrome/quinol oxidase subunit 3